MKYSVAILFYGLLFSAPAWAVALTNIGEPAMWVGVAAGSIAQIPFIVTAFFPRVIREALAHD